MVDLLLKQNKDNSLISSTWFWFQSIKNKKEHEKYNMNVHSGKYSARYMKRALQCVFIDAKLIKKKKQMNWRFRAWKISLIASDDWVSTQKISKKRSDEYVTIHSILLLATMAHRLTSLIDIINVWECSCSTQTQQHASN